MIFILTVSASGARLSFGTLLIEPPQVLDRFGLGFAAAVMAEFFFAIVVCNPIKVTDRDRRILVNGDDLAAHHTNSSNGLEDIQRPTFRAEAGFYSLHSSPNFPTIIGTE